MPFPSTLNPAAGGTSASRTEPHSTPPGHFSRIRGLPDGGDFLGSQDAAERTTPAQFPALSRIRGEKLENFLGGPGHEDQLPLPQKRFQFWSDCPFPQPEVLQGDAEHVGIGAQFGRDEHVKLPGKNIDPVSTSVMGEIDELL